MFNIVIAVFFFLLAIVWHEYGHVFMARMVGGEGSLLWNFKDKNVLSWKPAAIVSSVEGFENNILVRLFPIPVTLPFNCLMFLSLSVPLVPRLVSVTEWHSYSILFGLMLTLIESYHDIDEVKKILRSKKTCQL